MKIKACSIVLALILAGPSQAGQIGSAFTYQGELKQAGARANGDLDFEVEVFSTTNDDEMDCFRYEADGTPASGNMMLTIY